MSDHDLITKAQAVEAVRRTATYYDPHLRDDEIVIAAIRAVEPQEPSEEHGKDVSRPLCPDCAKADECDTEDLDRFNDYDYSRCEMFVPRLTDEEVERVALCGYEGEHDMPASWSCYAWTSTGGYSRLGRKGSSAGALNRTRERIWFSPHCLPAGSKVEQLELLAGDG